MGVLQLQGRTRTEVFVFGVIALCMAGGVGLCMSGLMVPNWVLVTWNENIVIVKAKVGLWRDELCDYEGCRKYWNTEYSYDRHPHATFTSRNHVRGLETSGTVISVVALVSLIPLWTSRNESKWIRIAAHVCFFSQSIVAAILCITGTLVLSAQVHPGVVDWAPFLSGFGGSLLFVAAILSCIPCLLFQSTPQESKVFKADPFSAPQADQKGVKG